MGLITAGHAALVDSCVGHYKPYATSHTIWIETQGFHEEVRVRRRNYDPRIVVTEKIRDNEMTADEEVGDEI